AEPTTEPAEPTTEPAEPTTEPAEPTVEPVEPTEEPAGDFYVYTDTVLQEDLVCRNLFLMGGNLECGGHNITVQKDYFQSGGICSLQDTEFVIADGVRMAAGEMDISGSSLHIGGDFVIDSAQAISFTDCTISVAGDFSCHLADTRRLNQERGSIQIGGNLIISRGSYSQFGSAKVSVTGDVQLTGNGTMYQNTTGEAMEIGGDLRIDSYGWSKFYNGQISLHGNLIQTAESAKKSLQIQDGFTLKFCGDRKQKIELAYPDTTTLGTLDFRDVPEMEVPDVLCGGQVYDFSKIGKKKSLRLNLTNMRLVQDEVIDCENLEWNLGTLRGSGYDLAITGNLTLHGGERFALSNASFTVKNLTIDGAESVYFYEETVKVAGDFVCAAAGDLLQNAGGTTIDGNLIISQGEYLVYGNGQTEVKDNLIIENQGFISLQDGSMEIGGDLRIRSEGKSYLDADQILLHGNLIQTEESTWDSLEIAKGCRMVFCGDTKQTIETAYPYSARLGTLDFRQAVAVDIPDIVCGSRIYDFSKIGEKESLYLELDSMKLVQDEIVHCKNLEMEKSYLSIREHSLTVKGNLTMRNRGDLYCNEGSLTVDNLTLDNIHDAFITGSSIAVSGDFSCASQLGMDISQTEVSVGKDFIISRGSCYGSIKDNITIGGNVRIEELGGLELTAYHQEDMQMEIGGDLLVGSKKQSRLEKGQILLYGSLVQTEA
ncbi:MAG: hypothetical protein K2J67_04680, partial [Lachnospiraceae bacterium]|nr:hypothetical protein [Lachnospiraceae bacterium]